MKRFIALALILLLAFGMVSCKSNSENGENGGSQSETSAAARILAMYQRKSPTKSVTVATYKFDEVELVDTTILVSGKIDGTKNAAVLTQIEQRLRSVANGSNSAIVGKIEETVTVKQYYEGRGVRTKINNGFFGAWDFNAENFAPSDGSITLNITDSKMKNVREIGKTISFTIAAADTASVFGKAITSDVAVTLVHDGACVVGITLSYSEPATSDTSAIAVEIRVVYTYDIEDITLD